MDTDTAISPEQAAAALAAVEAQYAHYLVDVSDDPRDRPMLLEPGTHDSSGWSGWMIVWECGPFEWAYRAGDGGVDEELLALAQDAGADGRSALDLATEPGVAWPAGVAAEPWSSFSLILYSDLD